MDIFDDNCLSNVEGKVLRGPDVICWIYIIYLIFAQILNTFSSFYWYKGVSLYLYNIFMILFTILSVYFMYNMCYICQGFNGFLIKFFLTVIIGIIIIFLKVQSDKTVLNDSVTSKQGEEEYEEDSSPEDIRSTETPDVVIHGPYVNSVIKDIRDPKYTDLVLKILEDNGTTEEDIIREGEEVARTIVVKIDEAKQLEIISERAQTVIEEIL